MAKALNEGRITRAEYDKRMKHLSDTEKNYTDNIKDYLASYGLGNPFDQFGNPQTNYRVPQFGYKTSNERERKTELERLKEAGRKGLLMRR